MEQQDLIGIESINKIDKIMEHIGIARTIYVSLSEEEQEEVDYLIDMFSASTKENN